MRERRWGLHFNIGISLMAAPIGNSNNKRGTLFKDQLLLIIRQEDAAYPEKSRRLRMAAEQLMSLASTGEEWAVKELSNRLDGRSPQSVELTGADGANFLDPASMRNLSAAEIDILRELLKKAVA